MSTPTRRRGEALESAILIAALDQLAEVGCRRLTMEGVAAAAHTGKAALYRRWSSREELIADALQHVLPVPAEVPVHDNIRDDLMELMRCYRDAVKATRGTAFQILKEDGEQSSSLMRDVIRERVTTPLKERLLDALERGVKRGDVRPSAAMPMCAEIGPAMVMYRCTLGSPDVPDEFLTELVDNVLLPAVTP
ncbi:TetR/AcrR family transcriptional regulator [Actinomadura rupiterrae]|uniref:TetR/AcrR family transcriptional regulator n=1 Tax=Actinomadura rupiterrae TaxID=559627 RepID=UPI0020A5FBB1|nr:TetR-like C-terminal domain-containing protein [Actinomadura rupiterrae]MCP2339554.1 AcrR family transcriptional regulator [Actinomadura rupiterrae]